MFQVIRLLAESLDRQSRVQVCLLIIPMAVIAVLEMASIALILPVVRVLLLDDTGGAVTRIVLDIAPRPAGIGTALWVTLVFGAFFVVKNVLLLAMVFVVNRVVYAKTAQFITKLYIAYVSRPLPFHFRRNSAEILRNLITGAGLSFDAMRLLLLTLLEGLLMVAAAVLLLLVEPVATTAIVAILLVVGFVYYRIAAPIFARWGARSMHLEGILIKWINQSLGAIRDVKLLHAYRFLERMVEGVAAERSMYISRTATAQHVPRLFIETIVVAALLLLAVLLLETRTSPADLIAILGIYTMAALRIMPSLNRILHNATELRHRTPYITDLHADLQASALDTDVPPSGAIAPSLTFESEIHLQAVAYAYADATHQALVEVDLTIRRGEAVGIVGPSGAGKSTLIDIVLGLLRPREGHLLVDGNDAFGNVAGWQRHLGYVPQSVYLLDDTLRRNIAFGIDDDDIDEMRITEVVRMASLDGVVAELPHGIDTIVGESGARLSGGQRQRVAIARALYRDPDVLVFDEATAALDNETERDVTRAIEMLAGDKTVLIIAHRLSTVRNCDKIVFMKAGRIVAVGTFDELLAENAEFRRMVQLGGFDTEAA